MSQVTRSIVVCDRSEEETAALRFEANGLQSMVLTRAQLTLLQLLSEGAMAPLAGFQGERDFRSVMECGRLVDGTPFPMPVVLSGPRPVAPALDARIALRDTQDRLIGILQVEEVFDLHAPSGEVGGVAGLRPLSFFLPVEAQAYRGLGGPIELLAGAELLAASEFEQPFDTVRRRVESADGPVLGLAAWPASEEASARVKELAESLDARVLVNVSDEAVRIDDFERHGRLDRAMRGAGATLSDRLVAVNATGLPCGSGDARSVLLEALMLRNYGAEVVCLGEAVCSEQLCREVEAQLGVRCVTLPMERSGPGLASEPMPEPRSKRGLCLWLTGLSGSGKSTIAEGLVRGLLRRGERVTLLDGDVVRRHLSKDLTFSREDRNTNVLRIGYVAGEIVRHGGVAICAAVSPYRESRDAVRVMFAPGDFVEIFVSTPLAVCEQRDVKGLYARARKGTVTRFTGVSDPYEEPLTPAIEIDGSSGSPQAHAARILELLEQSGRFGPAATRMRSAPEVCPS